LCSLVSVVFMVVSDSIVRRFSATAVSGCVVVYTCGWFLSMCCCHGDLYGAVDYRLVLNDIPSWRVYVSVGASCNVVFHLLQCHVNTTHNPQLLFLSAPSQ